MNLFARHRTLIIVAGLLLAALAMRLAHLSDKGYFFYDEASYMLEAGLPRAAIGWLYENRQGVSAKKIGLTDLKKYLRARGNAIAFIGGAKPAYTLALSAWALCFGDSDRVHFTFSVFLLLASMLLAFLVMRRAWGETAALFGLALLFFSVENYFYSRSGFPQPLTTFFLVLAVYLISVERDLWAGAALGLSFAAHYCVMFNLMLFGAWVLLYRRNKTLVFAAGFLAPLLVFQGISLAERSLLGNSLSDVHFLTFFQFLKKQFTSGSVPQNPLSHHDWLLVLRVLFRPEGIVMAAVSVVFLLFPFIKRFKMEPLPLLLWLNGWGALLLWIVSPFLIVPRSLFPEWFMVLAGSGVVFTLLRPRILRVALLTAIAVVSLPRIATVSGLSAGYRDAATWIRSQGNPEIVELFNWPIYQKYLDHKIWANIDRVRNPADLRNFNAAGDARYLVVDYYTTFWDASFWGFVGDVTVAQKPVARFSNGLLKYPWLWYHCASLDSEQARMTAAPVEDRDIRIYDLNEYYQAGKKGRM